MKKIITTVSLLAILFTSPAFAQSTNAQIPERSGDYPDPEHPGVRVRVFVHEPKDAHGNNPTTLSCADNNTGTPTTPSAGWHLPNGQWTYRVNTSSIPSTVSSNTNTIITESFNQWNAAQNKINLVRGSNTSQNRSAYDGQNIVTWGRTSGNALAVTYTRYYTNGGLVVDVDTIMNIKFPWNWTPYANGVCGDPNSYDAQNILTHEVGHWMGLDDTYASSFADNTLFGYGSKGEIKKDTLTTGDVAGVQAIYP